MRKSTRHLPWRKGLPLFVSRATRRAIIKLGKLGHRAHGIAPQFDLPDDRVVVILREAGVPVLPGNQKIATSLYPAIIDEYKTGLSTSQIANEYGVSAVSVQRILKKERIAVRDASTATRLRSGCTLNEYAFANSLGNEHAEYFIGLLMADGCVGKTPRGVGTVSLTQSKDNACLVEAFRDFLGSSHKLDVYTNTTGFGDGKRHTTVKLRITSDKIAVDLARFGVLQRKSFTAKVNYLETSAHFWRGCVDGDGWVSLRRPLRRDWPRIGLVGSKDLLEQFYAYAKSLAPLLRGHVNKMHSIWTCMMTGANAVSVISALYGHCSIALPPKLATAKKCLEWMPIRRRVVYTLEELTEFEKRFGSIKRAAVALGHDEMSLYRLKKKRLQELLRPK